MLNILSKEDRALLTLKYLEDYKYHEISKMTGLTQSAVKMRIQRAKKTNY